MSSFCVDGDAGKRKEGKLLKELSKLTLCCGQILILTALLTLSFWVALRENMPACYVMDATETEGGIEFNIEIRNQDLYKKLQIDYLLLRVGKLGGSKNTIVFNPDLGQEKPIVISPGESQQLPWKSIALDNGTSSPFEDYADWNYYLFQIVMRVHFGGLQKKHSQIMQSAHVYFNEEKSAIVDKRRGIRFVHGFGLTE